MKDILKKIPWDKLVPTRELMLWGVCVVAIFVLGIQHGYSPKRKKVKDLQGKIAAEEVKLNLFKKLDKPGKGGGISSNPAMERLRDKVTKAFSGASPAPDVLVSELMAQLTNMQYGKLAMVKNFTLKDEKKQKGYQELHFELNIVGRYSDIAQYLRAVSQMPYLVRTTEVEVKPYVDKGSGKVEVLAKNILYTSLPSKHAKKKNSFAFKESFTASAMLAEQNKVMAQPSPFASKNQEAATWSLFDLRLTGALAGSSRPTALINGKIFELGDKIAGYRIAEIMPQEVLLKKGLRSFRLKMATIDEVESPIITRASPSPPREVAGSHPEELVAKVGVPKKKNNPAQEEEDVDDDLELDDDGGGEEELEEEEPLADEGKEYEDEEVFEESEESGSVENEEGFERENE